MRQCGQQHLLGVLVRRGLRGHVHDVVKVVDGHVEDLCDQALLLLQSTRHFQVLATEFLWNGRKGYIEQKAWGGEGLTKVVGTKGRKDGTIRAVYADHNSKLR